MEYRHELKFQVSDREIEILRYRLKPIMGTDVHQKDSSYTVRSMYFDDLYDTGMRENEDGVNNRKKYRIRIYNGSGSSIKLEKKSKLCGMTKKEGAVITEEACRIYMTGQAPSLHAESSLIEKELYCELKMHGMYPKSIVEYERTAFIEQRGNVRITFDRNIRGSTEFHSFLEKEIPGVPLMPKGKHILEVKYDELLPDYISQVMNLGTLQRSAFSKYYYSRLI